MAMQANKTTIDAASVSAISVLKIAPVFVFIDLFKDIGFPNLFRHLQIHQAP